MKQLFEPEQTTFDLTNYETLKWDRKFAESLVPNYQKIYEFDEVTWKLKDFLLVPPYKENRLVDQRYRKCKKNLEAGLPSQYYAHLIFALKDIYDNSGNLIALKHNWYTHDGNTRAYVWKNYPETIKQDTIKIKFYGVSTYEQCDALYKSFDSKDAAETKAEQITGLYILLGIYPKCKKLKLGNIVSMLRDASKYIKRYIDGDTIDYMARKTEKEKVEFFKDEIIYLDDNYVFNKKIISNNIAAALLLVGKKYGVNNVRYHKLIENLTSESSEINNTDFMDGVTYVFNNLYKESSKEWTKAYPLYANNYMVAKALYYFDCFMKNTLIKKHRRKKIENFEYIEFYQKYIPTLD